MIYKVMINTAKFDLCYLAFFSILYFGIFSFGALDVDWVSDWSLLIAFMIPVGDFGVLLLPSLVIVYSVWGLLSSGVEGLINKIAEFSCYVLNFALMYGVSWVLLLMALGVYYSFGGKY